MQHASCHWAGLDRDGPLARDQLLWAGKYMRMTPARGSLHSLNRQLIEFNSLCLRDVLPTIKLILS